MNTLIEPTTSAYKFRCDDCEYTIYAHSVNAVLSLSSKHPHPGRITPVDAEAGDLKDLEIG